MVTEFRSLLGITRNIVPPMLAKPVAVTGRSAVVAPTVVPTYTAPPTNRTTNRSKSAVTRAVASVDTGAAAAAAAAKAAANNSARSSANNTKSSLQKQIDANNAQIGANQGKLNAFTTLVEGGLQGNRDAQLKVIDDALTAILTSTKAHAALQGADLEQNQKDNESSEGDASFANLANRAREKQDLVTQALSQGAGESDVLKTQLQALRNWNVNQSEINRSFFDTKTSIDSAITDLNAGTQTNLVNAELDAIGKKGGVFDDFYTALADAYTQMDNLATNNYLLQGEISAAEDSKATQDKLIEWIDSGKSADTWVAPAQAARMASPTVFTGYSSKAAEAAASTWKAPDVSEESKNFSAAKKSDTTLSSSNVANASTNTDAAGTGKKKRPEGATLRRW